MIRSKRLPIIAILVSIFNVLVSIIVNLLTGGTGLVGSTTFLGMQPIIALSIGIGIVLVLLSFAWYRRAEPRIIVKPTSLTLRETQTANRHAHRGLIVLTSLWNAQPGANEAAEQLKRNVNERLAAAQHADYQSLDLVHSPLNNVIIAVKTHSAKLEHCWFVCTRARNHKPESSSATYVPALVQYFQTECGLTAILFHSTDQTSILLDEKDSQIATETRDLIADIFKEAKDRYGLTDKDIVCDFTGCPRSMATGLIWACLDKQRDIQFVATEYNDAGAPVGLASPILYSFETQIEGL